MKKTFGISLALFLSLSADAGESFGGIYLDSTIPNSQARIIKNDLSYLYSNSLDQFDSGLEHITALPTIDGAHLYNWVYNRVKYIVGEDFKSWGRHLKKKKGHIFPDTPLPPSILKGRTSSYARTIIMSNLGAEIYLTGKRDNLLKGLRLNGRVVYAPSPRVGILKIGDGLFLERLSINKEPQSEANKIKRLGTIFHEARHSDGNSEHLGFIHSDCPSGHTLSGLAACEPYSNGPYSLDAVATKTLLINCKTCSIEDETSLEASIADSFSRVVVRSHLKTEAELLELISTYQRVIDFYEEFIPQNPPGTVDSSVEELARLKKKVKVCEEQLAELRAPAPKIEADPTPEGTYEEVSVERSSSLMKRSLKR